VDGDSGGAGLLSAMRSVNGAGIEVEDSALRQANPDELLLALTGTPATDSAATAASAA
jgi:hypothetical protein